MIPICGIFSSSYVNIISLHDNFIVLVNSLVPRPSRSPANIIRAGRSGRFGDVMMMSGGRGWPDMVVVWKNDRNVGDFKRRSGAQPSFLRSKTRVNSLCNADSLFEASRLLISLKTDRNSELTLVFERKNDG